jgi:hypothetical protein
LGGLAGITSRLAALMAMIGATAGDGAVRVSNNSSVTAHDRQPGSSYYAAAGSIWLPASNGDASASSSGGRGGGLNGSSSTGWPSQGLTDLLLTGTSLAQVQVTEGRAAAATDSDFDQDEFVSVDSEDFESAEWD